MSDVAVRVENLSKLYHIGAAHRHDTLRDALSNAFARFRRNGAAPTADRSPFTDHRSPITTPSSGPSKTSPSR